MAFKPNKAATCKDITAIRFPVICTPKLDGFRCTIQGGIALSNSLKALPSKLVQSRFACDAYEDLDGELIYGDPTAADVFKKTSSAVMSIEWPEHLDRDELRLYVFDKFSDLPYNARLAQLAVFIKDQYIVPLQAHRLADMDQLNDYEQYHTSMGYEGVMGRDPHGHYKQGRSTMLEGGLWKLKRFLDAEAEVIGFTELMHNANEATTNELGATARCHKQEGKVGRRTLGALIVKDIKTGVEFNVGTGFTEQERQTIWDNTEYFWKKIITYKYFPIGVDKKPRHPVFKAFRAKLDMSGS